MPRPWLLGVLSLAGVVLGANQAWADVILRGPFGRLLIVPAPVEVRVGPGANVGPGKVVMPAPPPGFAEEAPIVSVPAPLVRLLPDGDELPQPRVLTSPTAPTPAPTPPVTAIPPREFAKFFKAAPGNYEVLFEHPINKKPVIVPFTLPPGQPRVSYVGHALLFEYGQHHEVEIRFKLGGKVVVTSR
jgi:hypothetical protein